MSEIYETLRVAVEDDPDGVGLAAGRWGHGEQIVVASHGITANHLSWARVGELVHEGSNGQVSVVAVDHRGRAGSAAVPGPYGMARHARDVLAVLNHFAQDRAVLAGHSMGGFVVATAAEADPGRVAGLVLVDGGVPFPLELPDGADVEAVVQSVIGPALDRLDQRWPDEDAYIDFFVQHPAFQPPNQWWPTAEAYVRHDVVRTDDDPPLVGSSVLKAAVLQDGGEAIVDPDSARAIERVAAPTQLLWAPRGIVDQSPGLYNGEQVATTEATLAHLSAQLVDDVNHYSILVGDPGAEVVAQSILAAVDAAG